MKEWFLGGLSEAWVLPLDWAQSQSIGFWKPTVESGDRQSSQSGKLPEMVSVGSPASWAAFIFCEALQLGWTLACQCIRIAPNVNWPIRTLHIFVGDVSCHSLAWEIAGQPKPEVFWANALGNWQHLFGLSCVLCCNVRVSFCHALPWSFPFVRVQRSLRNGMLPEKVFCAWRAKASERPVTPSTNSQFFRFTSGWWMTWWWTNSHSQVGATAWLEERSCCR